MSPLASLHVRMDAKIRFSPADPHVFPLQLGQVLAASMRQCHLQAGELEQRVARWDVLLDNLCTLLKKHFTRVPA